MDPAAITAGLDEAQLAAVTSTDQPLVVLAGAGSGKTRVLTRRIGYRAAIGDLDPRFVLAVTFTRRAAGELRRRLAGLGLRDLPPAGTFHGIAYAQLRSRWADRGVRPPAVLDRPAAFVGRLLDRPDAAHARLVVNEIGWAKARLVTPETYPEAARAAGRRPPGSAGQFVDLFSRYEQAKRRRRVVDFDDLLRMCAHDVVRDTAFGAAVRWQVRHLFVDEFQDVNPLQFALLQAWMGDRRDLCVVGDADQAIYSWNGADARYLTDLARWFGPCGTVELRANHRSTPEIVAVGRAVLGDDDPAPTTRPSGPVPTITAYATDTDELRGLARAVRDLCAPGRSWSRQAVLVRTHTVAISVAQALAAAGIPHRLRGGVGNRGGIDAALRTVEGMDWSVARRELATLADREPTGTSDGPGADADGGGRRPLRLSPEVVEALVALADDYEAIDPRPSVERFTAWLATAEPPDARTDAVDVATYHAAKGLEWPIVHLCALEDGYVPIRHATTDAALAEERRLVHVAITRATEVVRFSWSRRRRFGERVVETGPSPYLDAIGTAATRLTALADDRPAGLPAVVLAPQRARLRPERAEEATDPVGDALESWRRSRAKAADVAPEHVLSDEALAAIVATQPRSVDDIAAIVEIGPIRASRWAPSILEVVDRALERPGVVEGP